MDNSTDEIAYKGKDKTFISGIFKGWEGYSLMCIDNEEKKVKLTGTEVSMVSEML